MPDIGVNGESGRMRRDFAKAPTNVKFVADVAEFGMILHASEFKGNGTLGAVLEWAQEGKGNDANGYRAGFIELVRRAHALKKEYRRCSCRRLGGRMGG